MIIHCRAPRWALRPKSWTCRLGDYNLNLTVGASPLHRRLRAQRLLLRQLMAARSAGVALMPERIPDSPQNVIAAVMKHSDSVSLILAAERHAVQPEHGQPLPVDPDTVVRLPDGASIVGKHEDAQCALRRGRRQELNVVTLPRGCPTRVDRPRRWCRAPGPSASPARPEVAGRG